MNRATVGPTHHAVTAAAIVLAAGTFLSAQAARAEFPLPLPHEIHREVREHVRHVLRTLDRIPQQILRESARDLEVFFGGNEYYGPHRHNHMTYNFPVWIDGSVDYRPYSYCNDHLYGSYSYRPQIWMGWGQESEGHWCNDHYGYYPNGHSCFRSRTYRRSTPRYYSDYDSQRYQRNQGWDGSRRWQDGRRDSPRARRQSQRYDNQRPTDGRSWRQPQGQVNRRPQQRGDRGNQRGWSSPQRSHQPQGRSDRQRQHDSKRNSKHNSKHNSGDHQGSRDHN